MRRMTRPALALFAALAIARLSAPGARAQSSRDDPFATGLAHRWREGCPLVVAGVSAKSPASVAGIQPGDQVLKIGASDARRLNGLEASRLLRADRADSVTLTLSRGGRAYSVAVKREKLSSLLARQGQKLAAGSIVPVDTTEAELAQNAAFDGGRIEARVFPLHYPEDPGLYYGGFELFVLREPFEVAVGGIEESPASRAGVHWGDRILAVNGVETTGKTSFELEQLFSSDRPGTMRLKVARPGATRTFEFPLSRSADLLAANGLRMANGQLVPVGMADEDVRCLTQ